MDQRSGYSMQALYEVKIIFYDSKIYLPQNLHRCVLDWYQLYLNHPGGSRIPKTIREVFYWKGLFMQADLIAKTCKICRKFKNIKTLYGHLPPKNIASLKTWNSLHVKDKEYHIHKIIKYTNIVQDAEQHTENK